MKHFSMLMVLLCAMITTGCEKPYATYKTRWITIESKPTGAAVYKIGPLSDERIFIGTTPLFSKQVEVLTEWNGTALPYEMETLAERIGRLHFEIEKENFVTYKGIADLQVIESQPSFDVTLEPKKLDKGK